MAGGNIFETQKIRAFDQNDFAINEKQNTARDIMLSVQTALDEKGYSPVNQIVGYILSGDPTYITGHKNARNNISKMEREELLEEIIKFYLEHNIRI